MGPLVTMTPAREVFTLGHVVVVDGSNTCFCSRRSRRGPRGTPGVRDERHPGYSLCWRRRQRHLVLVPPDRQNLAAHQCKHWWVQVWANQSNQHLARPPLPPCPTTAAMVRAAGVGPQRRAQRAAPSSLLEVVSPLELFIKCTRIALKATTGKAATAHTPKVKLHPTPHHLPGSPTKLAESTNSQLPSARHTHLAQPSQPETASPTSRVSGGPTALSNTTPPHGSIRPQGEGEDKQSERQFGMPPGNRDSPRPCSRARIRRRPRAATLALR